MKAMNGRKPEPPAKDAVYQALWSLPEEQRTAITLVRSLGLTVAQAAHRMCLSETLVRQDLRHGLLMLAQLLRETAEPQEEPAPGASLHPGAPER
jgi:DNA-directed RNA polymerase specialized sigma24 family protein